MYSTSLLNFDLNLPTPSGTPFFMNSTLCPLSVAFQRTVSPGLTLTILGSKTFDSLSSLLSISTVTSAPKAIFVKNILINNINELVNLLYLVIALIYSFKVNKQ